MRSLFSDRCERSIGHGRSRFVYKKAFVLHGSGEASLEKTSEWLHDGQENHDTDEIEQRMKRDQAEQRIAYAGVSDQVQQRQQ